MAKKRNRRSQKPAPAGRRPAEQVSPPLAEDDLPGTPDKTLPRPARKTTQGTTTQAQTRQEAAATQLEQEYSYVAKDLRRVFLLAGIMFALLIALNLLLSR